MAMPIGYGADWSERQLFGSALTVPVNDQRDGSGTWYRLSFTLRYADFLGQQHAVLTKEEYESHLAVGIRSLLIYQRTERDPDGGEARGREFGRAAVAYAKKIGYQLGEPIFATADAPIGSYNLDIAQAFFKGFAAVVREAGYLAGGYGFRDVIYRLQDRNVVDVLWLCGAESGWRPGIAIYQWNNGRIYPSGVEADLVKQFEPIPGGIMPLTRTDLDQIRDVVRYEVLATRDPNFLFDNRNVVDLLRFNSSLANELLAEAQEDEARDQAQLEQLRAVATSVSDTELKIIAELRGITIGATDVEALAQALAPLLPDARKALADVLLRGVDEVTPR